ncbi:uncharacterized protein LOC5514394 isoform X2 [Nematostella vectensis]|uniref:uncharacterized protein LOC5514394 isoform X2 n=1 Tax=Nematostella vectensis TaxID=45351 RepID=UPI0013901C59|nr:uncharacterized protein LOC5514394 isoform X2 [Nematostella vectensis]
MADESRKVFWLTVGLVSGVSTAYCLSELRRILRQKCIRRQLSDMEDKIIRLEDLEVLCRSTNLALKRSAEQLLLDRAMDKQNLEFIIHACFSADEMQVLKGVTVLGVLIKSSEYHRRLVDNGVIEGLAHCLNHSLAPGYIKLSEDGYKDVKLQRIASSALFDLICDEESFKARLGHSSPQIVPTLLKLMFESKSKEVIRWSIFVAHQLSLCDEVRPALLENDVIGIVSQMVVRNQGDNVLMRLCLQTLVMCINTNEEGEIQQLREMASHGIVRPAVMCLKSDDSDLIYWAGALIHEYSVKDQFKSQICEIPNVVRLFLGVLSTSEAILQRIILRVLSFLCVGNNDFRSSVLDCKGLLSRLPVCMASGDKDVVHWAVVLLHDLLLSTGSSNKTSKNAGERVVNTSGNVMKALASLASSKDKILVRLVAEIIGYFCSIDNPPANLMTQIIYDGPLEAILTFSQSTETDLQYWSSAVLLNLVMQFDKIKTEIIKLGGVKTLIELSISDCEHPSIPTNAAKTLVMLGFVDSQIKVGVKGGGLEHGDYMSIVIDDKQYCNNSHGVNIVVLEMLTFKVLHVFSYETSRDLSAVCRMVEDIGRIPVGAIVVLGVRGEANHCMTDDAQEAFRELGVENFNFKTGQMWGFVGQKKKDHIGEQIAIHRNYDHMALEAGVNLGRVVNEMVQTNILLPLMDLMMSTPPTSPINKFAELELLTIMARHDDHKQVMVGFAGFLEYMADLICHVALKTPLFLRENPMVVAHCIGAMKIISGISITDDFHEPLLESGVLSSVLTVLHFINGMALQKLGQQQEGMSPTLSPKRVHGVINDNDEDENCAGFGGEETGKVLPAVDSKPRVAFDENVTFDERKPSVTQSESSAVTEDFEDAFPSIVRLAVTVMYNCMGLFAHMEVARDSLFTSGTFQTLWCTLLTSTGPTLAQIGLPVEVLLNCCACMAAGERSLPDNLMELDERVKTPALVLSADRLEAYNMNWTFESIRATYCVGHAMYKASPHPSGWYYEVILKSNGIMQIGWQTEECRYGPERGVGVGDDKHSCAFDGARCKIWSGPPSEQQNNDYGVEWQIGDVLSCLFSWEGDVSFWLNGRDHGVAFTSLNTSINWYPAVSLAMDQHCIFNFGSMPFRYEVPDDYVPVCHVTKYPRRAQLRPSWVPLSGSFESIVEEEEEDTSSQLATDSEEKHFNTVETSEEAKPRRRNPSGMGPFASSFNQFSTPRVEVGNHDNAWLDDKFTLSPQFPRMLSESSGQFSSPLYSDPFSPMELIQSVSEPMSLPCFYFEAELKCASSKVKQIGFVDSKTGQKIFCDVRDDQLYLPAYATRPLEGQTSCKCPDVVGCGVMWPAGVVIFTMDGVGSEHSYTFTPNRPVEAKNLVPFISCSRIRCNFGQRRFLFEYANSKDVSYTVGTMLHSHGLSAQVEYSTTPSCDT